MNKGGEEGEEGEIETVRGGPEIQAATTYNLGILKLLLGKATAGRLKRNVGFDPDLDPDPDTQGIL